MPQSKSRKIAILGYRSVGEWLPLRCRGLNVGTRPGHVAGGRAGGARFVTSILSGGGGAFPRPQARRTGGGGRRPRGSPEPPGRVPRICPAFSEQSFPTCSPPNSTDLGHFNKGNRSLASLIRRELRPFKENGGTSQTFGHRGGQVGASKKSYTEPLGSPLGSCWRPA